MPSNSDLINEATLLATELGLEITTEGLTNVQLIELVRDLKAKKTDAETTTQADTPPEPPKKGSAPEPPKKGSAPEQAAQKKSEARAEREKALEAKKAEVPAYYMAPGKAVTSKRGILAGELEDVKAGKYTAVEAKFFGKNGAEVLKNLVKTGHVVKS